MSMDRNKTPLTHDVTAAVAKWMDERGFKPVETEVTVAPGWCADLAGVIVPTETELLALKLLPRKPDWNRTEAREQWAGLARSLSRVLTCAVEVKTSRGDYRGDRKWDLAQPTDLAYIAVPKGMVTAAEWPAGWGVLEVSDGIVRQVQVAVVRNMPSAQQLRVTLEIATRRDHHTRYARMREWNREERKEQAEIKRLARVKDVMRFVLDAVRGSHETFEGCCAMYKHRIGVLPESLLADLATIYDIRPLTAEERLAAVAAAEETNRRYELIAAERRARMRAA